MTVMISFDPAPMWPRVGPKDPGIRPAGRPDQ